MKQPLKVKEFKNQFLERKDDKLEPLQQGSPESSLNIISIKPVE